MNSESNKPDSAKDEPQQPAAGGPFASLPFVILAAVSSGAGAIAGITIGKQDGISGSMIPFGIIGMLLVSGALIWIVSPKWRRRYVAALPMFWLMVGGNIVMPLFVSRDNVPMASGVIVPVALLVGMTVGEFIMNRR